MCLIDLQCEIVIFGAVETIILLSMSYQRSNVVNFNLLCVNFFLLLLNVLFMN